MGYGQIGDKFGLVGEHVSLIARKNNIRRLRGERKPREIEIDNKRSLLMDTALSLPMHFIGGTQFTNNSG